MAIWARELPYDGPGSNNYSYAAPAWNKGLDKYNRDFVAGKVGREIKVCIKLNNGQEHNRPIKTGAETIKTIQRRLWFK